ncbi:hypothetical protein MPTK1_5g06000 [Marchantia polymorpha subsp. ruderalis]|uniref:Legume lectin domain-containing protein n=2 Tax=Marchantia polymorpha TaxID=3197 RepID=A0AAF6BFF4_MARPO|nr:hypothetical protein MARPO_0027s0027 [Marchantia polymorpha]BBN10738.1 hypothetical protein Mp_5g06000 [Marchantia polymorpha subsp. ruderalis]|eukprot:PTQ42895.1 hypothetical protein MARPO_0027s0027 [Marchantia polymorpha]
MYSTPVGMIDHRVSAVASFNTSFSFETKAEGQGPGDGLTFFITDNTVVSGAYGANFGVFYPEGHRDPNTTVVAVEFDTYLNWEYDYTPTPHVGLDIGSVKSKVSELSFNTCRGFENGLCSVWIDYDGASGKLVVCADSLPAKPKKALLNTTVNLASVFVSAESLWVGLSAGTGSRASSYVVKFWNFSSFWPAGPARRARGPEPYRSVFRTVLIVACVWASILVVSGLVMTVALRRRRVMSATKLAQQELNSHIPMTYSFHELEDATGECSEDFRLGEGGSGEVYRGVKPRTQALVAIKRLKEQSPQGEKEFLPIPDAVRPITDVGTSGRLHVESFRAAPPAPRTNSTSTSEVLSSRRT